MRHQLLLVTLLFAVVALGSAAGFAATRTPVTSSFIAAIGWSAGTLRVELLNGRVYEYYGVPNKVFRVFLAAPSKGRFFNSDIKGRYPSRRVR